MTEFESGPREYDLTPPPPANTNLAPDAEPPNLKYNAASLQRGLISQQKFSLVEVT